MEIVEGACKVRQVAERRMPHCGQNGRLPYYVFFKAQSDFFVGVNVLDIPTDFVCLQQFFYFTRPYRPYQFVENN